MSCSIGYNGWTNRETWLVGLWFNPEAKSDVDYLEEHLWEEYEKLPGFFKDCVDLSSINWKEIRETLEEEEADDESE